MAAFCAAFCSSLAADADGAEAEGAGAGAAEAGGGKAVGAGVRAGSGAGAALNAGDCFLRSVSRCCFFSSCKFPVPVPLPPLTATPANPSAALALAEVGLDASNAQCSELPLIFRGVLEPEPPPAPCFVPSFANSNKLRLDMSPVGLGWVGLGCVATGSCGKQMQGVAKGGCKGALQRRANSAQHKQKQCSRAQIHALHKSSTNT